MIDIVSCVDSNGSNWYEVDFLAQDKVPISTHYTDDVNRDSAYSTETGAIESSAAIPYSLTYLTTTKRFTRETNVDNTTSLVFGNGVLKNGQVVDEGFIDTEQIGIIIPGQTNDLNSSIDPLLGDEYSTLGETPNNTTLTVTYRVGGGVNSNIPSADISTTPSITAQSGNTSATLTSVTNNRPARGGRNEEDTLEIKEKAKAFFTTQNRCVTKEDYEARVMNIPSKFGNIAKVYVARLQLGQATDQIEVLIKQQLNDIQSNISSQLEQVVSNLPGQNLTEIAAGISDVNQSLFSQMSNIEITAESLELLSTINIYILGYNNRKQLVGNPNTNSTGTNDNLPLTLMTNIKKYLENFKLLTDTITLNDGYIVNFGVIFDVIAEKYANKQEVKLKCIQKIKDYFRIEKMQFNQPIFKSDLEYELMGVEGVRSIGHVTITQKDDYNSDIADANLKDSTYTYSFSTAGTGADIDGDGVSDGSFVVASGGTTGYGYKYNFQNALSDDGTIIVPPLISTPTVFELKNPNTNIQGRVR